MKTRVKYFPWAFRPPTASLLPPESVSDLISHQSCNVTNLQREEEGEKGVAESDLAEVGTVVGAGAGADAGDEAAPGSASACLKNFLFVAMVEE